MENGTRLPAETPTFSALIEAHIPMGETTLNLFLYQERVGEGFTHYALLNGHRVRPEPDIRPSQDRAMHWFDGLVMLFHEARVRDYAPRD